MATKRKTKAAPTNDSKPETVLVLRTCAEDLSSHGGFRWPEAGPVEAKDWNPAAVCGYGLHGWLWGEGDGSLANWDEKAKWLVVEVAKDVVVDLGGKVKFPRGVVVFCGDREGATEYLQVRAPGRSVVGGTSTSGYRGTSTSGDRGTSTSGDGGTSTSGDGGTSTSGDGGTSTSGDRGTSTSGYRGILQMHWWDGKRYRIATFYVGEDGIEPNQPYKVDEIGKPMKVEKTSAGQAA